MTLEVRKVIGIYHYKQKEAIAIQNDRKRLKICEDKEREDEEELGKNLDYVQCKKKVRHTLH